MSENVRALAVARAYARRAAKRRCTICHDPLAPVRRFSLTIHTRSEGKLTTRGAGAINLCQPCWRGIARQREKAPRPKAVPA